MSRLKELRKYIDKKLAKWIEDDVDSPTDEVLKDADAMHHIYNDLSKPVKEKEAARYAALKKEFGISS